MTQPESRNGVQPSEEETAALRLIESQHHDDDCDAHAYTTPESMRAALLKAFQLGARHESSPSETAFKGRRVVCAAVRAADGYLVLGVRHYSQDMHQQIAAREDGAKFTHRHDEDQGFVDQHGVFMTREEAHQVATRAGQIVRPEACGEGLNGPKLYSEGLY